MVLAAHGDGPGARAALAQLCERYWFPVYAFVRRQGISPHDAQDLTQEFFGRLIEKEWLSAVERERGRFRSWLLASTRHFLANEWQRLRTQSGEAARRCFRWMRPMRRDGTCASRPIRWMRRSFSTGAGR
jgi:DNA-directed RNA polymerase specialized sigma24 family protein